MIGLSAPLKKLATIKARVGWKGLNSEEFELRSHAYLVTGRDFRGRHIDWKACYQVSQERYDDDPFIQLRNGDILVTKDGTIGKVAVVDNLDRPACLNSGIFVVRPQGGLDAAYLYWVLQSDVFSDFIAEVSRGSTIQHLYQEEFREMRIPLRATTDQRAIADYLDREAAQIDAFIAKNEELITLLTERRSAVTAQAVTRGIERSVPLKDSGVAWLGFIPESWRTVRVKFAVQSLPGFTFSSSDFVDDDAVPRLLRGINVGVGAISWGETVGIASPSRDVERRYTLNEGDLVLGMDRPLIGAGLRIASIAPSDAGALLVQRVLRLRGTVVNNEYLYYSLAWGGFAMYIEPDFTGVSVPHMSEQQVGNFIIALPDLATQKCIVTNIREQHASIDAALATARRSVELARERRAALISAAVTGKIDVGVAA